jgi:hypothetical protein
MEIYNFLDSNLFQTVIIFTTGLIALIIYLLKKYNEKKDAARIIINEIRQAERAIQEIKNNKFLTELSIILPIDTWQNKKHLFLNNLDEDELVLLDSFYFKCTYAEQYKNMLYDIRNKAIYAKSNYMQNKLIDMMFNNMDNRELYEEEKRKLTNMADSEPWVFSAKTPLDNVIEYISNINIITTTTAGIKLKKIAK